MEEYRIKPQHQYHSELITLSVEKEAINLMGKAVTVKRPKRRKKPATEEVIRGATQADLEALYNAAKGKHMFIEKVTVADKEDAKEPAKVDEVGAAKDDKSTAGANKASNKTAASNK